LINFYKRLTLHMSPPPSYSDLGKSARDLFNKGFHFGISKLEVKSRTSTGLQLTSGGQLYGDTGKVNAFLESKSGPSSNGLGVTFKWNTDNVINTTWEVKDKLLKGSKFSVDSSHDLSKHSRTGKAKFELINDLASLALDSDLNLAGPIINSSTVVGHNCWLAGMEMTYDANKGKLVKNNLALGFVKGETALHANVNDGQIFGASYFSKVNPKVQVGLNLGWTASSNTANGGLAVKYILSKDTSVKAKINSSSQLGLGLQQNLRDGFSITLSSLIDGKNLNQGGHKIGCCLEFQS